MRLRATRLRLRRLFRRQKKQVEGIGAEANDNLDRHFIRRLGRLISVRRFLLGWVGLLVLLVIATLLQVMTLGDKYQVRIAASGGTYTEGVVGSFTNANPLYATGSVDSSVSRLLFASLLKYDENHQLVGDLAEKWALDTSEKVYTITLRPGLSWHDGKPLTARDIVYTYQTIQNPDTRSYLQPSWQGIAVKAVNDRTVTFTLPSQLSAFPHSLTNGIVPAHILGRLSPNQLRSSNFNTIKVVGAGPFRYEAIEVRGDTAKTREESVSLTAFDNYHGGEPRIKRFVLRAFRNQQQLQDSYQDQQLNAMVGLSTLPSELKDNNKTQEFGIPVMGQVMVFFKTTSGPLQEPGIRRALILGANKPGVLKRIPYNVVPSNSPLLRSHASYDPKLAQPSGTTQQANDALDLMGWVRDPASGIRSKAGQKLTFGMHAQNNGEYGLVAKALQKQWGELGVQVVLALQSEEELKTAVSTHGYDALLSAISLGPDPDVYAYWHSSQADPRASPRLNFSEYRSTVVDKALEAGRTRSDPAVRKVKYRPFLEAWQKDFPALSLYQPRFLYVARAPLHGFNMRSLVVASDRYANVQDWTIREAKVKYTPDLKNRL